MRSYLPRDKQQQQKSKRKNTIHVYSIYNIMGGIVCVYVNHNKYGLDMNIVQHRVCVLAAACLCRFVMMPCVLLCVVCINGSRGNKTWHVLESSPW